MAVSYRGSDLKLSDSFETPDLLVDIGIGIFNNNWQVPIANRFIGNAMLDLENASRTKVYVTGHSLGGFLAQAVSYNIIENEVYEHHINGRKIDQSKTLFSNDLFGQSYTFNAAPFVKPGVINFVGVFTSPIPYARLTDAKYDSLITNYGIEGDLLSEPVPELAERIGADPALYPKRLEDKNSHSLSQFYGILR